jgi:putative intracellular protease/amidase/uncharacterized protein YndB with AHSA1/START domain
VRIAFLLYDEMDLLDFAGPQEVLLTTNRLLARSGQPPAFEIVTASADGAAVRTYGGVTVTSRCSVDAVGRDVDVAVIPGAVDIEGRLADPGLIAAVSRLAEAATTVTSVCTGSFLLGAAGMLDGQAWTTHWEDLPVLAARRPGGHRARVVRSGRIMTAGGIVSGVDLGLHLVARFVDPATARLVARQMDYAWDWYGAEDGGTDPVVVERTVSADPATLYRLWTTSEGVREFLGAEADIDARIGGRYEYLFLDDQPEGLRGGEGCRILALEPDRMLAFTWNSPPGMPTRGIHTWVVVTFEPAVAGNGAALPAGEARTIVRLAHWGHGNGPDWDANRAYFRSAWDRVLTRLARAVGD